MNVYFTIYVCIEIQINDNEKIAYRKIEVERERKRRN